MVRFTPNGLSVMPRQRAVSLVRSSRVGWVRAVMKPSAPAFATAATSSARPTHCMPPCTIGCSTPTSSVKRVLIIPALCFRLSFFHCAGRAAATCYWLDAEGCRWARQKSILHGRRAHAEMEGRSAQVPGGRRSVRLLVRGPFVRLGSAPASVRLPSEGTKPMGVPGSERRLAAVLAADMVGFSRLMEIDEAGTLARLKTHRIELIDPSIAKNHGRIIKTTGDG